MARSGRRSLTSRLNDVIEVFSPRLARRREMAIAQRRMLMGFSHYDGAGRSTRGKDFRVNRSDAIEASRHDRARLSWISRDMLRNNPRAVKAEAMIVGQTVGRGIVPRVTMADAGDTESKRRIEDYIRKHCLKRDIDADGRLNLFGLQALAMSQICSSGEVLGRRRLRRASDGLTLPFQLQLLESDYLDEMVDGPLTAGTRAVQGVEFDIVGRRIAYHLLSEHPGGRQGALRRTRRVLAENVIHAFDQKRPGQVRGVSWYAPVITLLHELQKYQDGQVKRQEIASLFAAILKSETESEQLTEEMEELRAGAILTIGSDEEMNFTDPPTVEGYETFMRGTDRTLGAALGLTYEGFTGDYSGVNFSSARMGRLDTDPNVWRWQHHIMIDQFCTPFGEWLKEAIADVSDIDPGSYEITWTPPRRAMIDPTKEYAAAERAIRAGLKSRRAVIRETGEDPADVEQQIVEERSWAEDQDMIFSSDAGQDSGRSDDGSASTENERDTDND